LQALLAATLTFTMIAASGCSGSDTAKGTGAEVHGAVYTDVADSSAPQGKRKAFIPGVTVFLKNASTAALSSKVVTNVRGWFAIPHMSAGKYDLCWEAEGYVSGCTPSKQQITIQSSNVTPAPAEITPQPPVLVGRVVFPGNIPCLAQDPFFGLDSVTKVTLLDTSGNSVHASVLANSSGDFIMPGIPASGQFRVRAECDGITAESPWPPADRTAAFKLEIPNVNPRIVSVIAGRGERPLRRAELGTTVPVAVTVKDAASRHLHYQWFPSVPSPAFVTRNSATVEWQIANARALNTLYVLVSDDQGGHSIGQVNVTGGGPEVIFSGTVLDAGGAVLAGASVGINGHTTTTNQQGYFFIQLPQESTQYVLNISKDDYALFSKILGGDFVGATFSLVKSQTVTVDPTHDIDVTQSFRGQNRAGAEVQIPSNSLVNAQGTPPSGSLSISISTIDLHDPIGRLPGNFGGSNASGQAVRLSSYGGVDVQIRDSAGNAYNLAPGKTATLSIPVDPAAAQAKTPPPSLPLWFYNQQTGLWVQEGSAGLAAGSYKGTVNHFSSITPGFASSDAACMRFHVDPGSVGNAPFPLTVSFADSTGTAHTYTTTVNPLSPQDTIAELPPNEPITLEIGTLALAQQTINSGAASPGPANQDPPAASCDSDAYVAVAPTNALGFGPLSTSVGFLDYYGLDDDVTASTYYSIIDPTAQAGPGTVSSSGTTVTGTGGTGFTALFAAGDIISAAGQVRLVTSVNTTSSTLVVSSAFSPALSGAAYQEIGVKNTLANFKSRNGWTADAATATYFNANDLGFGRSMHMWRSGTNIFYYVTNYPDVETARLATAAAVIATVAMEYSPAPSGGAPYTKFYVFDAAGNRINAANLDQRGAKFVPRLCEICHGGTPATGNDPAVISQMSASQGNSGSRFIGFDLASYLYSGFDPAFSRSSQEEAFRLLNQGVLESTNPSAAQQELLKGWYSSGSGSIDTSVTSATIAASPSGLVRSNNLVTVTCTAACGVTSGSVIAIFGSTPVGSTVFDVASVAATSTGASATSFTFPQTAANDTGGGGAVFVGVQFDGFVPANWNSSTPMAGATIAPNTLYSDVQRTACRTCHVNRDPPIDWNTFSSGSIFSPAGFVQYGPLIGPYVCDDRIMAHAKVTYINFWMKSTSVSNPNLAQELLNAGLDQLPATAPCPLE
jgi:hypothetical protein